MLFSKSKKKYKLAANTSGGNNFVTAKCGIASKQKHAIIDLGNNASSLNSGVNFSTYFATFLK